MAEYRPSTVTRIENHMPRVEFAAANKVARTNFDYPKLKLENGERARIILLEDPIQEYVHTLRKPQIINGKPQMETKTRKNGEEYQDYKTDFVGRPLCLGDYSTLQDKGSDAKNCPMCAQAAKDESIVQAPQRRYAMHVVRYKTKQGSFEPITPFSVETVVWAFTDMVFNLIVDFKTEWDDLRKHDLMLGPCTNAMFQKFEINVGAKAAWLEDDKRKALTIETFKENQIEDLTVACGSKKDRKWIDEDLTKIREAWAQVNGAEADASAAGDSSSLDADLSSLLDDPAPATQTAKKEEKAEEPVSDDSLDDLLGDSTPSAPAEEKPAPAEEKAEAPAKAEKKDESADVANFDDLLADL